MTAVGNDAMPTLTCPSCGFVVTLNRPIPKDYVCAKCQFTNWRNDPDPSKPYCLSENDRLFLHRRGILPEI